MVQNLHWLKKIIYFEPHLTCVNVLFLMSQISILLRIPCREKKRGCQKTVNLVCELPLTLHNRVTTPQYGILRFHGFKIYRFGENYEWSNRVEKVKN